MKIREFLNESGVERLWHHNREHDCAALTAFRKARDCNQGEKYTMAEKKARNKSLRAKLNAKGYGVTELIGIYPEAGEPTRERSYFVVDLKDSGQLFKDIKKFGEEFEQDSVLLIPKGAVEGEAQAYLFGTNKCDNAWPGYGKKDIFKFAKKKEKSPIYTSYVKGQPFMFEEVGSEVIGFGNGLGYLALVRASERPWEELIEEE
jgi:hypothetical protein